MAFTSHLYLGIQQRLIWRRDCLLVQIDKQDGSDIILDPLSHSHWHYGGGQIYHKVCHNALFWSNLNPEAQCKKNEEEKVLPSWDYPKIFLAFNIIFFSLSKTFFLFQIVFTLSKNVFVSFKFFFFFLKEKKHFLKERKKYIEREKNLRT